jgi:hypothetical protein
MHPNEIKLTPETLRILTSNLENAENAEKKFAALKEQVKRQAVSILPNLK